MRYYKKAKKALEENLMFRAGIPFGKTPVHYTSEGVADIYISNLPATFFWTFGVSTALSLLFAVPLQCIQMFSGLDTADKRLGILLGCVASLLVASICYAASFVWCAIRCCAGARPSEKVFHEDFDEKEAFSKNFDMFSIVVPTCVVPMAAALSSFICVNIASILLMKNSADQQMGEGEILLGIGVGLLVSAAFVVVTSCVALISTFVHYKCAGGLFTERSLSDVGDRELLPLLESEEEDDTPLAYRNSTSVQYA